MDVEMLSRLQFAGTIMFHYLFPPTGLYLFGWPDAENETVRFGVRVPSLLSLMVYNDPTKPVPAMDQIPAQERPPVWLPFQTFHRMVGLAAAGIRWVAT